MLNGQRQTWSTKTTYSKKQGLYYHRICPQHKHLSAITNNGFEGISWFMFIPMGMLIAGGVLLTVYITWILGVLAFIAALVPHAWVIYRYYDSTPYKWEEGSKITHAESAYLLMSRENQRRFAHFLEAVFKGYLDPVEAKKLFALNSEVSKLEGELKNEIEQRQAEQKILNELNALGGKVEG